MASPVLTDSLKSWWREHSQSLCRLGEVFLSFGSCVLTIVSFGSPFWIDEVERHIFHAFPPPLLSELLFCICICRMMNVTMDYGRTVKVHLPNAVL